MVHGGIGALVCCGEAMCLMRENIEDAALEKHVPVISGNKILVGSVLHPMTEDHYIEWVEITGKSGETARKFLTPEDDPIIDACFDVSKARAYCNLHGLWKS